MTGGHPLTQRIKLWWIVLTFLGGVAAAMMAEELILRAQGNQLNFSAPQVRFLSGRPFERMKNSDEVIFNFRAALTSRMKPKSVVLREKAAQFRISYDLWEERFKVVEVLPVKRTRSGLLANEAEAWCFLEISGLDVTGLDANQPFWTSVEIWSEDESTKRVFGKDNITDDGISLTSFVEQLSPLKRKSAPRWTLESGPNTLEQLRRLR